MGMMEYPSIIANSDCLEFLKSQQDNIYDSMVTDPPAGISFMNKDWDCGEDFIGRMQNIFTECLRTMKPGAHGLVWALPRTSHWTAMALEKSGFEIRDVVTHLFGTGFPKSLDIGKAIGPATELEKQWQGWGTALKPASEHWILIRKPCSEKTVAANVARWGCGGLNIDASRIGTNDVLSFGSRELGDGIKSGVCKPTSEGVQHSQGRFPANLVLDEEAAAMLDEQSGPCKTGDLTGQPRVENKIYGSAANTLGKPRFYKSDAATGASRFFYVAKASKSERGVDNNHPTVKSLKLMEYLIKLITPPGGIVLEPFMGSGTTCVAAKKLGFRYTGIEKEVDYFSIAKARVLS